MINIHRLLILLIVCILNTVSYADDEREHSLEIKSATVDGSSSTSVTSGATISVEVILKRSKEWQTTKWIIKDSDGSTVSSQCHTNTKQKGDTTSFDITSPSTEGTYSISFIAYKDDKCKENKSNTYTLSDAIIVGIQNLIAASLWHLDESSWDGTTDEVIDSTGNNNGTTINGTTPNSTSPAIVGDVGTCGYGNFDGSNDYISTNGLYDVLKGTASLSFWIRTTQIGNNTSWMAPGVTGIEQSGGEDDIFWGWLDASGHIGISVGNDYSAKSTTQVNDGQFHHIVLSRNASSGAYAIYIDGNLNKSGTTGAGIIGNSFSSIGRVEDTGGSPEYFQGDLDEIQFFHGILSLSEVQSLMNETHTCPATAPIEPSGCSLIPSNYALYSSRKITVNNSIIVNGHSIGYGVHSPEAGIDLNGNITSNNTQNFPALTPSSFPDNPSNTSQSPYYDVSFNSSSEIYFNQITQNGSDTSITFTGGGPFHINDLIANSSNVTLNLDAGTYYINNLTLNGSGSKINITHGPVYLHIGNSFTPNNSQININKNGAVNDLIVYLHKSATFTSNSNNSYFTGYIYGPEAGNITFNSSNINFHGAAVSGQGNITVNSSPLVLTFTDSDKAAISSTGNCAATVDHFELSYLKNGLTCMPSQITLKACSDSNCNSLYTSDVTATLSPSAGWSNNPTTLAGSNNLTLQHTIAGSVTLGISSSTVTPTNNLRCYADNVLDANCSINFAESGFVFDVPVLTACKTSADVIIKAVKKSETSTQCIGALTGSKQVKFWSKYISPTAGTNSVKISGTNITTSSSGTAINLDFNSDGEATFTAEYQDAGQLKLNASYDNGSGLVITGDDTFVSRPVALAVYSSDANSDCASSDASCSKFKRAGENFNLKVKAACWTDDSDTDFTDNPETANFELDSIGISHSLFALIGNNGTISVDTFNFSNRDNGIHTISQTVSEVGVFKFSVNPPNYFGETIKAVNSLPIGRFYPDHFKVSTTTDGSFGANACTGFSYSGQTFTYQTKPQLKVIAYNAATPAVITQNYTGDFVKLTTANFNVTTPTTDAVQLGADATHLVKLTWMPDIPSLTDNQDGSVFFTFSNDNYTYLHEQNSQIAPFSNAVNLSFTAIKDSDGVSAQSLPYNLQPSGENIRFGRFNINNAHGSELAPLTINMIAEYFNGFNWVNNTADQCTNLTLATHVQLSNTETAKGNWQIGTSLMTITDGNTSGTLSNNSPLINGQALLTLSAPGEDNQGYVDIRSQLSGDYNWLLGDYDNDGNYDDNPSGRASFGLFKGTDNIIFRRELY